MVKVRPETGPLKSIAYHKRIIVPESHAYVIG